MKVKMKMMMKGRQKRMKEKTNRTLMDSIPPLNSPSPGSCRSLFSSVLSSCLKLLYSQFSTWGKYHLEGYNGEKSFYPSVLKFILSQQTEWNQHRACVGKRNSLLPLSGSWKVLGPCGSAQNSSFSFTDRMSTLCLCEYGRLATNRICTLFKRKKLKKWVKVSKVGLR